MNVRRARRKNILLDVKWVVQLINYKQDFPHSFRRIKIRDSQSIKERDLFYNFWFISRYSPNKEFIFLENERAGLESFSGDKFTPTAITIFL